MTIQISGMKPTQQPCTTSKPDKTTLKLRASQRNNALMSGICPAQDGSAAAPLVIEVLNQQVCRRVDSFNKQCIYLTCDSPRYSHRDGPGYPSFNGHNHGEQQKVRLRAIVGNN